MIAVTIPGPADCSLWLYTSDSAPKNDDELGRLIAELPDRKPTVRIMGVDCQLFQRYVASIRLDALVQIGPRLCLGNSVPKKGCIPVVALEGLPTIPAESLPNALCITEMAWMDRASVLASLPCSTACRPRGAGDGQPRVAGASRDMRQ